MNLTLITHDSPPELHAALDSLLLETFGFTLSAWQARGHWTADYTCYALFEGGQALANAGVYRMEMLVCGEKQVWLQIGGVATRQEWRGKGLSRRLLEEIFTRYPQTPFFLFANDSVVDFYPRFGFQRLPDCQPLLRLEIAQTEMRRNGLRRIEMRRLSVADPLVGAYLNGRACFSGLLDCANAAPLNWFHLLLAYADCIYEIPALQTMLVARQQGATLSLKDVITTRPGLAFADLLPLLGFDGVREIRFGFNPDWLGVAYEMAATEEEDATPIFFLGQLPDDLPGNWPGYLPDDLPENLPGDLPLPVSGGWMLPLLIRT